MAINLQELNQQYLDTAKMLKAISDPKRLQIVDMLSCGEMCACVILEYFDISQPTLSHDMKVLVEAGLVTDRREGKNTFYALNNQVLDGLIETLSKMFSDKEGCICKLIDQSSCCQDGSCC